MLEDVVINKLMVWRESEIKEILTNSAEGVRGGKINAKLLEQKGKE